MRLLKHENGIVKEDNLDKRWEASTGEVVHEVIFLSKHTAVSNHPAHTVHPIGMSIPGIPIGRCIPSRRCFLLLAVGCREVVTDFEYDQLYSFSIRSQYFHLRSRQVNYKERNLLI